MTAPAIPAAKALLRTLSLAKARSIADHCLGLADVTEIFAFLKTAF